MRSMLGFWLLLMIGGAITFPSLHAEDDAAQRQTTLAILKQFADKRSTNAANWPFNGGWGFDDRAASLQVGKGPAPDRGPVLDVTIYAKNDTVYAAGIFADLDRPIKADAPIEVTLPHRSIGGPGSFWIGWVTVDAGDKADFGAGREIASTQKWQTLRLVLHAPEPIEAGTHGLRLHLGIPIQRLQFGPLLISPAPKAKPKLGELMTVTVPATK